MNALNNEETKSGQQIEADKYVRKMRKFVPGQVQILGQNEEQMGQKNLLLGQDEHDLKEHENEEQIESRNNLNPLNQDGHVVQKKLLEEEHEEEIVKAKLRQLMTDKSNYNTVMIIMIKLNVK